MPITTTRYAGHEAIQIEAGAVRLMVTTSVGPRVLGLLTEDGRNHFAELPEMTLRLPRLRTSSTCAVASDCGRRRRTLASPTDLTTTPSAWRRSSMACGS